MRTKESVVKKFKPRMIIKNPDAPENVALQLLLDKYKAYIPEGWNIVVVDQRSGFCYYDYNWITIPMWTFRRSAEYFEYYVCHELSHIDNAIHYNKTGRSYKMHGEKFYDEFKRICPKHLQRFEYNYKPRAAFKYGVIKKFEKVINVTVTKPIESITVNIWNDIVLN
jgi:hypothetical protein